jgi:hypothetical protein
MNNKKFILFYFFSYNYLKSKMKMKINIEKSFKILIQCYKVLIIAMIMQAE